MPAVAGLPLVLEVLASLVRRWLSFPSGYLVAHHVITADLGDRMAAHVVEPVAMWAPARTTERRAHDGAEDRVEDRERDRRVGQDRRVMPEAGW